VRKEYESKLQMRLRERDIEVSEDLERKWNAMKSIIKGVAMKLSERRKLREMKNDLMENVLNAQ
jgi:transcription initiation factor TFIIIB Brf1 subunit/transcription initiation factor TFIIB